MTNRLLSVKQVAELLGYTTQRVYSFLWTGALIATRVGRYQRISLNDLDNFLGATETNTTEGLIPVSQAAFRLGGDLTTLYQTARSSDGLLPLYRFGERYYVSPGELDNYLSSRRTDIRPDLAISRTPRIKSRTDYSYTEE